MRLDHSFCRSVGIEPPCPALGGDVAPVDEDYLENDNVFKAPRYDRAALSKSGLCFAYNGPEGAPAVTVSFYFWDEASAAWYLFEMKVVVAFTAIYLAMPTTMDFSPSRQTEWTDVAIVVVPPDDPPDGDYTFSVSSVTSGFGDVVTVEGSALPAGAATEVTLQLAVDAADEIADDIGDQGTWTPALAAAPADSGVISAAGCSVRGVMAVNSHATTTVYLMLFNLAAVPANGTAPRLPAIPLAPGQAIVLPLDVVGRSVFGTGLCWAASTTIATLTLPAPALNCLQVSADIV